MKTPITDKYKGRWATHFPEGVTIYDLARRLESDRATLMDALEKLLQRDMKNTCQHEDTHRGGFIWEICDHCHAEWADDRGGKPEWQDPQEWTIAESALASARANFPDPS